MPAPKKETGEKDVERGQAYQGQYGSRRRPGNFKQQC